MRTGFEVRQVLLSPAFVVLMAWGLATTTYALSTPNTPGRPNYPTTLTLLPSITEAFEVVLLVIAILYAGELVWRERDRKIHEIVDATPLPNWAYVVPKTLAMGAVLLAVVLTNAAAAVLFQLASGYTNIEPAKYLLWYVLPVGWDVMLLAALAMFIQAVSPHKTIGWAVMVLFIVWKYLNQAIDHNLLNYGTSPGMPLSDMYGAGTFWQGAWVVRAYWGAFAVLLLVAAHLLWRRGTDVRLRPRLANMRRRLRGGVGIVAAAALVVLTATGAYAYYNINVLNEYRTPYATLERQADLEKKYWRYVDLPQPTVSSMALAIDLYPEERRAMTRGRYVLRNLTPQPVTEVHVRLVEDGLELISAHVDGARLVHDDPEHDYRIYRLEAPMAPGDERVLTFETRRWHRGFRNGPANARLVENGTFLDNHELTPVIGMRREGTLEDATARRHFGLPPRAGRAKLEDTTATDQTTSPGGWTSADITLSTSADQTPIAPGRRVSDVTRGGRRIARFVSEAPIREKFSVQSARYAVKRKQHDGVDLAVYYHPGHEWNVDRMLNALGPSLDYYREAFGPYQFDHVRIVEYPGYANFAQAFAGTIAYSETYGFIADFRDPATIDHVTATTAHELAHQWWAHQITGANMEGSMLLSETLANYSALMMLRRVSGEAQARAGLQYMLRQYLAWRAVGTVDEPPLMRVENQSWIGYQKGALAMNLVQVRLGEDAVNRALRTLLARYRFKGAPYPRSVDLVDALKAEARTEEDRALIADLFERVIVYELRAAAPTAVQRPDGKWDVTVPVEATKYTVDDRGTEHETPFEERIEVGLFTAEPGSAGFDSTKVLVFERHPIRAGRQVLKFVTDRRPTHAGLDPYNYYIDRNWRNNVAAVGGKE